MQFNPLMGSTIVFLLNSLWWASLVWAEGVGMVTGSTTGTYYRFGQELAEVARKAGLDILVKESQGSLDNISRLISKENAALAIVQSDVLGFLNQSRDADMRRTAAQLRLIFPFYNEEVHLLARQDIRRIEDLNGKKVVVGAQKSGNWLTASYLLDLLKVRPAERLELPPPEGMTAILTGKAEAMFYIAGKPVKLFTTLGEMRNESPFAELAKQVHFVPLPIARMPPGYTATTLGPSDYPWVTESVNTIAVKAMLISFDFSGKRNAYQRQRCAELGQLGGVLRQQFASLQSSGHPKWKEVNLDEDVSLWKRDTCSQQSGEPPGEPAEADLERQLKCRISGKC